MRVFLLGFLRQSKMFRNENVLWAGEGKESRTGGACGELRLLPRVLDLIEL